jgi:hypothetical protein
MTINKGYSVDVSDISAIVLVCHGCNASVNLPPSDIQHGPIERCPNCKTDWFDSDMPDHKTLKLFMSTLRDLRKRTGMKVCQVRLEITQPL